MLPMAAAAPKAGGCSTAKMMQVALAAVGSAAMSAAMKGPLRSAATDTTTTIVAVIATLRTRAYQKNGSGDMIPRRHCLAPGMTRHGLRAFGSAHARLSFTSIGGPLLSVW